MRKFFNMLAVKIRQFDRRLKEYSQQSESSLPYMAYVNWGIKLSQNEDIDEAIEKLETSAEMNPNSPYVQLNLGQVYMKKGAYDIAIQKFRKTIRLDNTSGVAYSLVAACLVLQNEFKDAETYYKKGCEISPENPDVRNNYATALARKGKRFKALEIYKETLKTDENNFFALHCSGVILCDMGKFEEALEKLIKAEKIEPQNPDTLLNIAICKLRLDDYKEALSYVEKALEIKKKSSEIMMIKGACLAKAGKEAECLACFSANEPSNSTNFQYYTYWGMSLQIFGRYAEAKEKFLQAFELNREDEFTLFYLAENYVKEGNSTPALHLFQKITEINSKNSAAFEKIGDILYRQNKYKDAIEAYSNGIKASRKHLYLYNRMAKCFYESGDLKNSSQYYQKAIDYCPDLIEAYTGYTNLLMQMGNYKEALRKIRAAHKKAPDNFEVNNLYSQILIKLEMFQDAIEKIDKLIKIEPQYYQAIFTKAEVLNAMHKPQEAIGILQSLPEYLHDTRDFLYISMISYDNLAQLSPSHYNISKAIEFCDRLTDKYSSEYKLDDLRNKLDKSLKSIEGE